MNHLETLKEIRDYCSEMLENAREDGANMDAPIYVRHAAELAALDAAVIALKAMESATITASGQRFKCGQFVVITPDATTELRALLDLQAKIDKHDSVAGKENSDG